MDNNAIPHDIRSLTFHAKQQHLLEFANFDLSHFQEVFNGQTFTDILQGSFKYSIYLAH